MKQQILETIKTHKSMVDEFEQQSIEVIIKIVAIINSAIEKGHRIYICGNGGSAADAQHIAAELVGRFQRERKALPAIALTTNSSTITSVANDYTYENIFSRQVEALAGKGDILWAISTSGSSPNIIAAAKLAKDKGVTVIAFTGKKQSQLEQIADVCLCAAGQTSAASQEIHQLAYHIICGLMEQNFSNS